MLQLACSVAIILIIRYDLQKVEIQINSDGGFIRFNVCLMSSPQWPGACYYAYVVASTSILLGFLLSLMQCLTMDCCGIGRLAEVIFDILAIAWWLAAGIVLASAAQKATGLPGGSYRAAVVALCWVSVLFFIALLACNSYLVIKVGRSYLATNQAMGGTGNGIMPFGGQQAVQMSHIPGGAYAVPTSGVPVGYPVPPPGNSPYPPPGGYFPQPGGQYPGYYSNGGPPMQQPGVYGPQGGGSPPGSGAPPPGYYPPGGPMGYAQPQQAQQQQQQSQQVQEQPASGTTRY